MHQIRFIDAIELETWSKTVSSGLQYSADFLMKLNHGRGRNFQLVTPRSECHDRGMAKERRPRGCSTLLGVERLTQAVFHALTSVPGSPGQTLIV